MSERAESAAETLAGLARLEGVASGLAGARDGIDALLRDRGLRRTSPELTVESLLRGAAANAALDGSVASLGDLRGGAQSLDEPARAALRVSAEVLSLVPVLGRSPLQALARLHALAAGSSADPETTGRPRSPQAATRLRRVGEIVTAPTDLPALLVAAVAHAEIATAEPFASHNGLVARALERLVLVARGVDEPSVTVPEAGHLAMRSSYDAHLRGYADGGPGDVHAWLLYAARAYTAGAEASPLAD